MLRTGTLSAAAAAVAGFAVTIAALWPGSLAAVDQKPGTIAEPSLLVNGIRVTLTPTQQDPYKAGDQPVLRLQAVSTDGRTGKFTLVMAMTGMSPASEMSRMGPMDRQLWRDVCPVDVSAERPFLQDIPTCTKLPAGNVINVRMVMQEEGAPPATRTTKVRGATLGKGEIVAFSFSTPLPAKPAATRPSR